MDALSSHPEKLCILVSQYSALILSAPCPPTKGFAERAEFAAFLYSGIRWRNSIRLFGHNKRGGLSRITVANIIMQREKVQVKI